MGSRGPRAGGAIIAVLMLVGAFAGATRNQPSAGFLAGGLLGGVVALLLWLRDRRRPPR